MGKPVVKKEERSKPLKRYYENRERLLEKVECDVCKSKVSRMNFNQHLRSTKHSRNLKKIDL